MFNYGFELFVNLFQGVMFTVFCYKFLTPSRNKICEGIAFCVASLLMFFSITLINWLYLSFAYIETVVFFAIMIPYCVLFFKDRIFVKILTPVILNVIYSVLSFGINYIFSAIISCDYNYLMIESSQYRYMYVLMSNLIFVIVLFIIYNLFKNSLSHIHKQEILITLVIPLLSIAVGLLTFLVSSNADMSDFDRIVLGAVSIIILSFTFINFYLIKSLSKNYSLENENILLNKEKELYNVQMTSSEKYMKNLTDVKHDIQNQLLCIENLIDGQRYDEAKKMCNNVNNNISANVHFCKTGYVYNRYDSHGRSRRATQWDYEGYEDDGTDAYVYYSLYHDGKESVYEDPVTHTRTVSQIPKGVYFLINRSTDSEDKTNLLSNNILSSKDLKIIKARFNSLKSNNRFASYKDMTLGEYMTSGKLINAPSKYMVHQVDAKDAVNGYTVKPTKILTSGVLEKELPLDGSRTLKCNKDGLAIGLREAKRVSNREWSKYGGGYYFTPGKEYSLINPNSSDYDRKASKEYFQIHKEYDATVYDLESDSMKNNYIVLQAALYGESHSYWSCDEAAYFYNTNYKEPYFIFPIG